MRMLDFQVLLQPTYLGALKLTAEQQHIESLDIAEASQRREAWRSVFGDLQADRCPDVCMNANCLSRFHFSLRLRTSCNS